MRASLGGRGFLFLALAAALGAAAACKSGDEKTKAPASSGDEASGATTAAAASAPGDTASAPRPAAAAPVAATSVPDVLPADSGKHGGELVWQTAMGGPTRDSGRGVAVDAAGNAALAGYFSSTAKLGAETLTASPTSDPKVPDEADGFVAVVDADGKPRWTRQLGGTGAQIVSSVAFDGDGNVIASGWFGYELTVGEGKIEAAGADDAFVAKFDRNGRRLWVKRFGGRDTDGADDIAVDPAGNIYVTGVFRAKAEFGAFELEAKGMADVYLLELNPDGEVVYAKSFGERYDDFGRSLAVDARGNVVLLGEFSSTVSFGGPPLVSTANRDLFIAKFSPTGKHIWSKGMGTEFDEMGLGVAVDPTGSVIITGSFDDEMSFGGDVLRARGRGDVFLAKYDASGAHMWSKQFGGGDEDIGSSVATDSFGNILLTGWYRSTIDFGGGPLQSHGKRDAFLAKLAPDGHPLWARSLGDKESDTGRSVAVGRDQRVTTCGTFLYKLHASRGALHASRGDGDDLPYQHDEGALIPYSDVYLLRYGP